MPRKKRPIAQYDKILKENFEAMIPAILRNVLGITSTQIEPITEDLQYTLERKPDALMRVTDAEQTYLLHIEFQTRNDIYMANRMLQYYALLLHKFQLPIQQYVVYLGNDPLSMTDTIRHPNLTFQYHLISLRDIPYQRFIQSEQPEAILLSVLSNYNQKPPEVVIREILLRLFETPIQPLALERYLQQLRILSNLNNHQTTFDMAMQSLIEAFKIERDPFYQRGIQKGLELAEQRFAKRLAKLEKTAQKQAKEAEKQAKEAEKQAKEAEKQAKEAEKQAALYETQKREIMIELIRMGLPISQIATITHTSEAEIIQLSQDSTM